MGSVIVAIGYAFQLLVVSYWRIVPVSEREHDGVSYSIFSGSGMWDDFIPLVGLMPLVGEPVHLVTRDLGTGIRKSVGYDIADDVYAAFPTVWPDQQR